MEDLRRMMAHSKADTKLEKKNERVGFLVVNRVLHLLGPYPRNGRDEKLLKGPLL